MSTVHCGGNSVETENELLIDDEPANDDDDGWH